MDAGHSSEYISALWGALRAGHSVKMLPSSSIDSIESLRQEVVRERASVLLVSPNHATFVRDSSQSLRKKDILGRAFPEVFSTLSLEDVGQPLSVDSLPDLRFIVQTGFYNQPGFVKFRDMLVYRSNKYNTSRKVPDSPPGAKESALVQSAEAFRRKLEKEVGQGRETIVCNLLDLQEPRSVDSLLACLALAQERQLLTNVVSADNLQELLLDKQFLSDLSQDHNVVVVGSSEHFSLIRDALGADKFRFLDIAGK